MTNDESTFLRLYSFVIRHGHTFAPWNSATRVTVMPAVFFTNLALLGGLAALAIPILIHLLLKRKAQRLRFSTIQFFVQQDEQASKRRRLRHWLLLTARLLLVSLLVLAFSRPYWKTTGAADDFQKRRVAVFVLDCSASMQATIRGQTQWSRA